MTTQQNLRSDQSNQLCLSFEPGKDFSIALNTLIRRLVEKIPKDQMYSFHYVITPKAILHVSTMRISHLLNLYSWDRLCPIKNTLLSGYSTVITLH